MGSSFSSGLAQVGNVFGATVGGALNTVSGMAKSILTLDPAGFFNDAINNISTTVSRVKHYAEGGTGDGVSGIQHMVDSVKTAQSVPILNDAMNSISATAPQSVKDLAVAGAAFHEGLMKHGSVIAAARHAGANSVTKHLADGMSSAVLDHIRSKTGMDMRMHQILGNPVTSQANMLSSLNVHRGAANDMLHNGGAEAAAMQVLGANGAGITPDALIVQGGA